MSDLLRATLRDLVADTLSRKWAHDNDTSTVGALDLWRPYADAVLEMFDIARDPQAAGLLIFRLRPAVPAEGEQS